MVNVPTDNNLVPLKVTVTFDYDAEVFPGDPDDVYELIELEYPLLDTTLRDVIETLGGRGINVNVLPEGI